jgi:GDP-L-fucose synthase
MEKNSKIYVAGHNGMVGSAIVRKLRQEGYTNLVTVDRHDLDLRNPIGVNDFFRSEMPEYVFLSAAKVGGILANDEFSGDFIYDNIMIQSNILKSSQVFGVKKLLFLGSSCIYPKLCKQPIKEEYFLSGKLEETNDAYAIAKIAGIKMCQSFNKQFKTNFISVMPSNLYGIGDNYDSKGSHVLPALIRKFHEAKIKKSTDVLIWGTGEPKREFLYVDDLADACYFLMMNYDGSEIINIGSGEDISIQDLSLLIKKIIDYSCDIEYDISKPNGTMRKLLDVSKINSLGWYHKTSLEEGIKMAYNDFLKSYK